MSTESRSAQRVDPMSTASYDFVLPPEQIATAPVARGTARMLVVDPSRASLQDAQACDLVHVLRDGDLLIVNDARVTPARIQAQRETGGAVEVFVCGYGAEGAWEPTADGTMTAMVRANKRLRPDELLSIGDARDVLRYMGPAGGGLCLLAVADGRTPEEVIASYGRTPLPPYIVRSRRSAGHADERPEDVEDYQTVYARTPGAVAAPTAGLHLTRELIEALKVRGVSLASVTLLVGIGTFKPVATSDLRDHEMHTERYEVSEEVLDAIRACRARSGRVVAVGTTVVRALESFWRRPERVAGSYDTRLMITPGFEFRLVDAMLTNFHLPKSTLLALVSAFMGYETMMRAYEHAIAHGYRFFSYGDAMFIASRTPLEASRTVHPTVT